MLKDDVELYNGTFEKGNNFVKFDTNGMFGPQNEYVDMITGDVLTQEELDYKNKCKKR